MEYRCRKALNAIAKGMDLATARIDQKRYSDAMQKPISAFLEDPTYETFRAAVEALEEYQKNYTRWVAPVLSKHNQTTPEGNQP